MAMAEPPGEQTATDEPWPSVTVIVPVRNGAGHLAACLEALLNQVYPGPPPELIFIDNGSTDGTVELLNTYRRKAGSSLVIGHEPIQGASSARNAGIRMASSEWITFTDVDCLPRPNWLRELITAARLHPRATFIGGAIGTRLPANAIARFAESLFDHRDAIENCLPPYVITANLLARRSDLLRFGLFDPAFPRGQDVELAWRAHFEHGAQFAFAEAARIDHCNVESLWSLWHKGIQHGHGSALVWSRFETRLGVSRHRRMCQLLPYWDVAKETLALFAKLWYGTCNESESATRIDPFFRATFLLARHLSFIYHTLWNV
jgi:glycosyltransferase involved in cell wall biosynthesis